MAVNWSLLISASTLAGAGLLAFGDVKGDIKVLTESTGAVKERIKTQDDQMQRMEARIVNHIDQLRQDIREARK